VNCAGSHSAVGLYRCCRTEVSEILKVSVTKTFRIELPCCKSVQKLSMLHRPKVLNQLDTRRRHPLRTHDPQSRGRRSRGLHAIIDSGRRSAETCSRRELHLRQRKFPLLERNDNSTRDHQQTSLWRPLQLLRQESSLYVYDRVLIVCPGFLVHGQVTIIFVVSVCLFVCLSVCAEFFSAVFDPISIKLGHMLYLWV